MTNNSKNSRSKDNETLNYNKILICSLIGTVMFFFIISFFSFIALKTDFLTKSLYMPIGILSAAVSSFICGFMSVKKTKKNGALFGSVTGLAQALISSLILFLINNRKSGTGIFILIVIFVAFGAIGGISAVNMKVRKKYK